MGKLSGSLRSALFVLWLVASVIPWAIFSFVASIFMRGTPLYWFTIVWLRLAIHGARVICGVRWRMTARRRCLRCGLRPRVGSGSPQRQGREPSPQGPRSA